MGERGGSVGGARSRARLDLRSLTLDGALNWMLGLAAVRVWIQCILFGGYTSSDDGLFTIINNFGYGAAILTGALLAARARPGERMLRRLGWTSFALKVTAPLLLLAIPSAALTGAPLVATGLLAGVAGALGAGVWTAVYARLDMRRAVFYGFCSLALGSVVALLVSFMTPEAARVTSILMAALAQLCYRRALEVTAERAPAFEPTPAPVYDDEPRSTALVILGGLAVFGFALGISRGFPAGEPVPMSAGLRAVHQLGVAALSAFVVWWAIARGRRLSFSLLWRIEIIVVAAGMFTLSAFPGHLTGLAIALVNIADSFMLGVLWVTMQDVSRHCSAHAYSVFGVAWAVRVFSREAGRVLILALGSLPGAPQAGAIIGTVTAAVAASMAIILGENVPRVRALFAADDEGRASAESTRGEGAGMLAAGECERSASGTRVASGRGGTRAGADANSARARTPGHASGTGAGGANTRRAGGAGATTPGRAGSAGATIPGGTQTAAGGQAATGAEDAPVELDGAESIALSPTEVRWLQTLRANYALSDREAQVAVLIAQGRSKAAIARHLYVSENTVRTHAKNAYAKLGVRSKTELAEFLEGLGE